MLLCCFIEGGEEDGDGKIAAFEVREGGEEAISILESWYEGERVGTLVSRGERGEERRGEEDSGEDLWGVKA